MDITKLNKLITLFIEKNKEYKLDNTKTQEEANCDEVSEMFQSYLKESGIDSDIITGDNWILKKEDDASTQVKLNLIGFHSAVLIEDSIVVDLTATQFGLKYKDYVFSIDEFLRRFNKVYKNLDYNEIDELFKERYTNYKKLLKEGINRMRIDETSSTEFFAGQGTTDINVMHNGKLYDLNTWLLSAKYDTTISKVLLAIQKKIKDLKNIGKLSNSMTVTEFIKNTFGLNNPTPDVFIRNGTKPFGGNSEGYAIFDNSELGKTIVESKYDHTFEKVYESCLK